MKNIDYGQIISATANIGVIVGLGVLIYEVRQNTQALQNETDVAIYSAGSAQNSLLVQDPVLTELLMRAQNEDWSSLSPVERRQVSVWYYLLLDRLELQYRLYVRNAVDLDPETIVFPQRLLSNANFIAWWESSSFSYQPDFVVFFDSLLERAEN